MMSLVVRSEERGCTCRLNQCFKKNKIPYFAVSDDITELDESLIQVKAGKAEVSII